MSPVAFWAITAFVMGITVGSFLTAVIYRLNADNWKSPEEPLSLLEPQRSMCPNCKHSLGPIDLVPLFSFLLFGQKCRYCKKPISWRYFGIELLTGLAFVAIYLKYPHDVATMAALLAFTAVLIPIFFIDLASFHIPLSLTLLASVIPLCRDSWGIAHHQVGYELLWGWMPRSLMGWLLSTLFWGLFRIGGWLYKGIEAMGLGDVLLARGMGAMLMVVMPAGLSYWPFPLWVFMSSISGIAVYPLFKVVQRAEEQKKQQKIRDRYGNRVGDVETAQGDLDRKKDAKRSEGNQARIAESGDGQESDAFVREGTLWDQVRAVLEVLIAADAYEWLMFTFNAEYRKLCAASAAEEEAKYPEMAEWTPQPTAIPFGPFLVVGFLLTVFGGEAMILAYLAYAHLLPGQDLPKT